MIPTELLEKIRRIEFHSRHLVNEIFGGDYHSVFKGRGMEFAEVREYTPGDEIRTIDWNVTARTGKPFIKLFDEERELTLILMIDASASGAFGTSGSMKRGLAAELAAVLAFSAIKNNDKAGVLLFTEEVETFIPPRKGKNHVLSVIHAILQHEPKNKGTNYEIASQYLVNSLRKKAIVVMISDFIGESYQNGLKILNQKHDLINLHLQDQWELELPNLGLLNIHDAETNEFMAIDTAKKSLRDDYALKQRNRLLTTETFFKRNRMDYLRLLTSESYVNKLSTFFRNRAKRMKR